MLPPEVRSFVQTPGRALVVKGRAGGGKTLFAMELARWYQLEMGDVLWIDSREADLVASAELEKIVPAEQRIRVADAAPRSPLDDAIDASAPDADDALAALADVAEAASGASRPLVVLDSLDGLTEGLPEPARSRFVRAALHLARSMRLTLVLVRETDAADAVDYLADGVLVLASDVVDGAREREVRLEKLRGTPIRRAAYAATLAEGRFAIAKPPSDDATSTPLRPAPRADTSGRASTGNPGWDRLLHGGLARGSVALLELDPDLGPLVETVLAPLLVNHLNLGRGATVLTPPNLPRATFAGWAMPHVATRRGLAEPLRALEGAALSAPSRFGDRGASLDERLTPLEVARDAQRAHGPVLSVLSVDALAAAFPHDEVDGWLASWALGTRDRGDLDVLLATRRNAPLAETVADGRWRLDVRHGAPVLRGRVPETEPFFVTFLRDRGFPEADLLPVQ